MRRSNLTPKKIVASFVLAILPFQTIATISTQQLQADETISKLYHRLAHLPSNGMANRLDFISAQFIEKPYILSALGEGADARFDQDPRYRTDGFDCDTYVNTVLALALAMDKAEFQQCINNIRYKNGHVNFITRNHFISLDWNLNNQKQDYIKDITTTIRDKNNKIVAQVASTLIDKPSWYQHFSEEIIHLNPPNAQEQAKRLAELKALGSKLAKQRAEIPYLPLTALLDTEGHPNEFLFNQIPHGAIIEIVRPNWNLKDLIGTNLNVSHLGFVFRKKEILYFRQASSQYSKVVEIPLIAYLQDSLKSPTIKGINVEIITPQHPFKKNCQAPRQH